MTNSKLPTIDTLYLIDSLYLNYGEQFLSRERCRYETTVVAALLAGSQIYCDTGSEAFQNSSDWDGALLLATNLDIFALVNEHWQMLVDIFEITQEEYPPMYYRIHQATRLEDGFCILHDQWIFKPDPSFCVHWNDISPTSFGIMADMLVSGA